MLLKFVARFALRYHIAAKAKAELARVKKEAEQVVADLRADIESVIQDAKDRLLG